MEQGHLRLATESPAEEVTAIEQTMPLQQTVEMADAPADPHADLRAAVDAAREVMKNTAFNPVTGQGAAERRAYGEALEALRAAEWGEPEGAQVVSLAARLNNR